MKQNYKKYTEEDHKIWSILSNRQFNLIKEIACEEFLTGVDKLNLLDKKIPDFKKLNQILAKETGWEIIAADGIVPAKEFFELLYNKKFPSTTWIRSMENLNYIEEPDIFHDVFGHAPVLTDRKFTDFLQELARITLNIPDYDWDSGLVSNLYWHTIEFGIVKQNDKPKLYGAGILSSIEETIHATGNKSAKLPFNLNHIFNSTHAIDKLQEVYYVINSFEELYECLVNLETGVIEEQLNRELKMI